MTNIDIKNVLYHGIIYGTKSEKWDKFENILRTRYISSLASRYVLYKESQNVYDHYVCLGSHPDGNYAHKANDFYFEFDDGWALSQSDFGFLIDPKIINEQECMLEGMSIDNEILVKDNISLEKYALGIYNAGGTIDYYRVVDYLKTNNKYIDESLRRYNVRVHFDLDKIKIEGLNYFITNKEKYLKVEELLKKYGYNLPIIDEEGKQIISIESQKKKVKELIQKA